VIVTNVLLNIVSTVGVVLANKYLWTAYDFRFMVTLSFFHFAFTTLGCRVLLHYKFFEYKAATVQSVMPLVLGSFGSVVFMNLNLAYNRCGVIQPNAFFDGWRVYGLFCCYVLSFCVIALTSSFTIAS
jgi:hypothetical protein